MRERRENSLKTTGSQEKQNGNPGTLGYRFDSKRKRSLF